MNELLELIKEEIRKYISNQRYGNLKLSILFQEGKAVSLDIDTNKKIKIEQ